MTARADATSANDEHPPAAERNALRLLRWFALALFLACAGTSALITGPITHHDEGSYLLNAAAIAGKLSKGLVAGYYSGYSLLIAPAYLLFSGFSAIYHYALLLNALLLASVPFALRRVLRCAIPHVQPAWHTLAAIAASCQVALLTDAQQSISDNLLVPLYAWTLAFGAAALLRRRPADGLIAGAFAGALFLVHPRGAMMALPMLAALSLPVVRERGVRVPVALMWACAFAVAMLHWPLEALALKTPNADAPLYSLEVLLRSFAGIDAWLRIALNTLGVFTYIALATFGVAIYAWRELLSSARVLPRALRDGVDARSAVRLAMLLGLIASILVTALYFNTPDRIDKVIYGRYALPAMIPVLALGIACFGLAGRDDAWPTPAWWAVATTLFCIVAMALAFRYLPHPPADTWVHTNIVDLYIPFSLVGRLDWPTIGFYFCLGAFVLYSITRAIPRAGAAAYAVMNIAIAIYVTVQITLPSNELRAQERQAEPTVRAFERVTGTPVCISIAREIDAWHGVDYQAWLFDRIEESAVVDRSRCVRGIIAPLNQPSPRYPRFRLVSVDLYHPYGLFIKQSDALDRFSAVRALPPADFPSPIAENERSAKIDVVGLDDRTRIRAGTTFAFRVHVTHAGGTVMWPALFDASPVLAMRAAARLDPLDGGDDHVEFRADLRRSLAPGESTWTTMVIGPFTKAGRYRIEVGAIQEGIAWFDETQIATIEVVDR